MWQRIQSVFLGLAILSLLASLFMPVWEGTQGEVIYRLYPIYFMTKATATSPLVSVYFPFSITAILIVATITIGVQEFRRFDNRMLQIKLGTLNALLLVGVMVSSVLFVNQIAKEHPGISGGHYSIGLWLFFVAVIGNWLAMRFIRRDENIVRDSDRLR